MKSSQKNEIDEGDLVAPVLSVKQRILDYLSLSENDGFIRREFDQFGTKGQIDKAISCLIEEKKLVRVGLGIYAKSRPSRISEKAVLLADMMKISEEALQKLGVIVTAGRAYKDLASGKSTQVPMIPILNVGTSRTKRKIAFGPYEVTYERDR